MDNPKDGIAHALEVLRSQSLSKVVQRDIERRILSGELRAGERINENRLAEKLSISRGPVREACRALEQAGLITLIANRGLFVRKVTLKEALDAYDIRASLFGLAGRILAPRITADQIAVLSDLVERMEAVSNGEDVNAYYPLNLEFHSRLVEFTGNEELADIYHGLVKKLHLFRRSALVAGGALKASSREHRAILDALIGRNAKRAKVLMENHVLAGRQRFLTASDGRTHTEPSQGAI